MSKGNAMSDFVRQAVIEKAKREWGVIQDRSVVYDALEGAQRSIEEALAALAASTSSLGAAVQDPSIASKFKKLRKALEEAKGQSSEIANAIDLEAQRASLHTAQTSIRDALAAAGMSESELGEAKGPAAADAAQ